MLCYEKRKGMDDSVPLRSFLGECYDPMQEVTPKVVATAVRMVMTMLMIFCQSSCLFMVCFEL